MCILLFKKIDNMLYVAIELLIERQASASFRNLDYSILKSGAWIKIKKKLKFVIFSHWLENI